MTTEVLTEWPNVETPEPATNGVTVATPPVPPPPKPEPRLRLLGRQGDDVTLAEQRFHLAVHTGAGIQEFQTWYAVERDRAEGGGIPLVADDTLSQGQQLVEGIYREGRWDLLRGLLERAILEPLPEGIELETAPDELAAVLDAFMVQNGFKWLAEIIKNSVASQEITLHPERIQALLQRAERLGDIYQKTTGTGKK